ncbi:MAG: hypothetical protein APF80_03110 [Alphaproteobacteria bacterium BRH_c36]|nr:MAG: hypothetical protein APF80_03110 [Alphaproteobacteria bacterium BRH_c36]
MNIEETKGCFGFHLVGVESDCRPPATDVQIFVKSSCLSHKADLAISPHLRTAAQIDRFVNEALAALQVIRDDAKRALAKADSQAVQEIGNRT